MPPFETNRRSGFIHFIKFRKASRGQTALETAFVFTAMLFLAFAMMNLAIAMHTKFIATYAAFMAGRSYQVYGDHQGLQAFEEQNGESVLSDLPVLSIQRTAEDIYSCALPWVQVDEDDIQDRQALNDREGFISRCAEGNREYAANAMNTQIQFVRFDNEERFGGTDALLETVEGSYHEIDREPLRYAILRLQHRRPFVFDFMGLFDNESSFSGTRSAQRVYAPVLLNPGIGAGVIEGGEEDSEENPFEEGDDG